MKLQEIFVSLRNDKNNLISIVCLLIFGFLLATQWLKAQTISSYELSQKAPFNQVSHYPVTQTVDQNLYKPTGNWVGRLILPEKPLFEDNRDAVWIEIHNAPPESQNLIGEKVKLSWNFQDTSITESYVKAVTTDVNITTKAKEYESKGNVIPNRLDRRTEVGPLQSLAGARPEDDIFVRLDSVILSQDQQQKPILLTNIEPVQITGEFYGLVKIIAPTQPEFDYQNPQVCPESKPCPSEYFQVNHYNKSTGKFDGVEEIIRIPQQPLDYKDRFMSTPRNLADSPAGEAGWYIYGAKDKQGIFTVQSLKPRALFQLKPQKVILDKKQAIDYIKNGNWENTPQRKGTFQSVLVNPQGLSSEKAINQWQEGDKALVIHLFGGTGGKIPDPVFAGTVSGHFAYGLGKVIRDPFTDELQFDIIYQQIYVHNPNAIISGSLDWTAFTGDMRRGWLGSRPISDIIIKLDTFTNPIEFKGKSFYFLKELFIQAQVLTARYRTGDGTGMSTITPATSCVQDSNQALYIAIEQLKRRILAIPEIKSWYKNNVDDPESQKFTEFIKLGIDLRDTLTPRGVIRPDWQENAESLAGIKEQKLFNQVSFGNTLDSWNTMLPRQGHDEISRIFLDHGASLWFLRTNQIGGEDPNIEPIAPTIIFGQYPIIARLFARLVNSFLAPVTVKSCFIAIGLLIIYGAISIPLGLKSNFLSFTPHVLTKQEIFTTIKLFFFPALSEEILMRVFLLPHPTERALISTWLMWAIISILIFVIYHPLNALTFYKKGNPTFFQPIFLISASLLGLICAIAYYYSGSVLIITLIHWIVVIIWLFILGGKKRLNQAKISHYETPYYEQY